MSQSPTPPLPPTAATDTSVAAPAVPQAVLQQVQSIRRILLIAALAFLGLVIVGSLWGYLWHQGYYFYSTNDATISGNVLTVAPKAGGTITTVYHQASSPVHKGDIIAVLQKDDGGTEDVRSPIDGTIVQEAATPGETLQAGQTLAQVVDLSKIFVTAYVEDTHIKDVHVGQGVDVTADSVSGLTLHGTVAHVQPATAATLGALPTTDYASGNFTKVTQRVPVQISLDGIPSLDLFPGVPANVTIHIYQ